MAFLAHSAFSTLYATVLDIFFPPRCVGCREVGTLFCDECRSQIVLVEPPFCHRCGGSLEGATSRLCPRCRTTPHRIERIRSVAYSEGVLREAIHAFKYQGITALAGPLADLMADHWAGDPRSVDVVIPVPLHKSRLRARGFNQAACLARELSRRVGLTVDEGVLVRHRATAAQVELNADQRKENVREAFRCVNRGAADKHLLLIDDVCTTGSTLEACAAALLDGGARSVQALTLARAR